MASSLAMTNALLAGSFVAETGTLDSFEVARLRDTGRQIEVAIAPGVGNMAFEMKVKGHDILWTPTSSLSEIAGKRLLSGNPFLAPWANRLEGDAFHANGRRFTLNAALGNLRRDANQKPIHGLLAFSHHWEVIELRATEEAAWVRSRLEFFKHPELMAQFPFAHTIEVTYRLAEGRLEVRTRLENHAREAMPVAIGFHPYFRLDDAARDEWKVRLPVTRRMILNDELIPTGESESVGFPDDMALAGARLDDVFTPLERDAEGRAAFRVMGASQQISVVFGPRYAVAVVYAPPGRDFICFEPMAAVTNALDLAHRGVYSELQSIAPGDAWTESFWVVPEGF